MSQNLSSFMTCILIFREPSSCFAYLKDDVANSPVLCSNDSFGIDNRHVVVAVQGLERGDVHRPGTVEAATVGALMCGQDLANVRATIALKMSTVLLSQDADMLVVSGRIQLSGIRCIF